MPGVPRLGVGPDRAHADAGVVDDGFDGAEALRASLRPPAGSRLRARAAPAIAMQAPVPDWHSAFRRSERGHVAVHRRDLVAVGEQRLRHHSADAAGGAGQQHNTAWHLPCISSIRRWRKPIGSAQRLSSMLPAKSPGAYRESMSGLKIYGIARTRAFRALWMAKELGLDYEHDADRDRRRRRAHAGVSRHQSERPAAGHRRRRFRAVRVACHHALSRQEAFARPALSRHAWRARRGRGNGACGRSPRSIAASTSGRCMRSACRRRSATPPSAPRR